MATTMSDGSLPILEGFVQHARYMADLVGRFLTVNPFFRRLIAGNNDKVLHLPAPFLLELGAILYLATWEHAGLQPYLPAGLPSARDAFQRLVERWSSCGVPADSGALLQQVLITWWSRFAWHSLAQLNVDVLMAAHGDDQLLEDLADFLWDHRHLGQTSERI